MHKKYGQICKRKTKVKEANKDELKIIMQVRDKIKN